MYIIGAHHPLLGLLDLVALPPVSSLQLKVGHPAQGQGCHQGGNQGRHQYGHKVLQDLTENCKPGRILPVVRLDVLLVVHGGLLLHVVGDDDLVGLRGGALDGGAQPLRLSAVTARLLPVEWVRLPHSASLHRPLEYPGDHGVVRLVCVLQHLQTTLEDLPSSWGGG